MIAFCAETVFDGQSLRNGHAFLVKDGVIAGIVPRADVPDAAVVTDLGDSILAPGFVDLQVNGGGGVMFNDAPTVATLARVAKAHAGLGTTALLPTLITDTPAQSMAAIEAAVLAVTQVPGIVGLHLEGPHLSVARKGAHDPDLIRPMDPSDLVMLQDAARRLPALMITVAPETVTPDQIAALASAGVIVSLGHSDADFDTCVKAAQAGAHCVTHLFNAMSQLSSRAPGLVGTALHLGELSAGLIADGIHVHPASIAAALRAKQGPGQVFLVTDAMATAGSDIDGFTLNGRRIQRRDGRLTLADGTLAGADLTMAQAVQVMTAQVGTALDRTLAMATRIPADILGRGDLGRLTLGGRADFVRLSPDLDLCAAWQGGVPVEHTGR